MATVTLPHSEDASSRPGRLVRAVIVTVSFLSLVIPTKTIEGYPGISHYKNLIFAYPKTTFLSRLIPGYPGIGHRSGYPGISRYKSGFGRVSFFQMS